MCRCECKKNKRKCCCGKKQVNEKEIFELAKKLVDLKKLKKNLMKKPK